MVVVYIVFVYLYIDLWCIYVIPQHIQYDTIDLTILWRRLHNEELNVFGKAILK